LQSDRFSRFRKRALQTLLLAAVLSGGSTNPSQDISVVPALDIFTPASYQELTLFLDEQGYDWDTLGEGVPSFILTSFPPDLDAVTEITERKRLFFLSLLPIVLLVNDEISRQREELKILLEAHESGIGLIPEQEAVLTALALEYLMEGDPLTDEAVRDELLKRIDIIPPSMVLAQAANESGYGTSRFALEGNNIFGEWTFTPGSGFVPDRRPPGKTYEVRRFPTLYDSVRSYTRNINTHWAYQPLRDHRATLRKDGLPLRGAELAAGLTLYSIRRDAYVREIRSIIRGNHLSLLSSTSLRDSVSAKDTENWLLLTVNRTGGFTPRTASLP
jgi:Bax protein